MKSVFIFYAIIQLLLSSTPSQGVECPDNYYGVDEGITLNECRDMGNGNYEKYWCQDENTVLVGFYNDTECSPSTESWTAPYECTLEGDIHGLNAYPCKCDFSCTDPASNSVDRITSDCAGNEIEPRETVTIDECQFEPFPNEPSRPFKYFCDDSNQLGLKYYTRGVDNCDGTVQLETILDSAGQCVDGLVFSSTCGQSIPTPNCNHFYGTPINTCVGTFNGQSNKFRCIDDNTMESTSYEGEVCDESKIIESHQILCQLENGCYCAAPEGAACDVSNVIVDICGDSEEAFDTTIIVDECLYFGDSLSTSYHCNEENQLVAKDYDNDNCQSSPGSTEETYPKSCLLGSEVAVTCGGTEEPNFGLVCPEGTKQIGRLNADIGGCGLQPCDDRYQDNYQNIQDCNDACVGREDCLSFSWAPMDGDKNHPGKTVCTLYPNDISNQEWGPAQIMCKPITIEPTDGLCCDCIEETTTPGCSEDFSCETIICDADFYCCDQEWDSICSSAAIAQCSGETTTTTTTTTPTTTTKTTTEPNIGTEFFNVVAWNQHHQTVGYEGNFFGAYHTDVDKSGILNDHDIYIEGKRFIVNYFGQSTSQPETGARIDYIYVYDTFGNQANFKNIFGGNGVTTSMIWSKNKVGYKSCKYYGGYPADTCSGYLSADDLSYGYYCVDGDSTKIEEKWFYGNGCDENQFKESFITDCPLTNGCNCNTNNVCQTVDQTITWCGANHSDTEKTVIGECIIQFEDLSSITLCENGVLVNKWYKNSNACSGEFLKTTYDSTCEDGGEIAYTTTGC